jgi:hypothetical protein
MRSEWRWVALVSLTLIGMAFAPFMLIAFRNTSTTNWQFMGLLHDYHQSVAYLTRMNQGAEGLWLTHFQYTPEPHLSALVQPLYPLLGQLSRVTSAILPTTFVFHLARLGAAFFMYITLYQLAASIWMKVRTRRIFFIVAALGSGLGWMVAITSGNVTTLDLTVPQAFPFFSTLVNIHYPLTVACLALLAAILIVEFRPGATHLPSVNNGAIMLVMLSLALAFLQPEALLPLGIAVTGSIAVVWYQQKSYPEREVRWAVWLLVPALPVVAYYWLTLLANPVVSGWVAQKAHLTPTLFELVIGLGLPLLIALPGIGRAVRYFEADGDRFMLLWFAAMTVCLYLPVNLREECLIGYLVPLAYFAARASEDTWLPRIVRRWRRYVYILLIPLLSLSSLLVLFVPITPIVAYNTDSYGMLLEPDYGQAFIWLREQIYREEVILAAPDDVSAWVPVWTGGRVIYGHPSETVYAEEQRTMALTWYQITDADDPRCVSLLVQPNYQVIFVLDGPRERQLGRSACLANLRFAASFGQVNIYTIQN